MKNPLSPPYHSSGRRAVGLGKVCALLTAGSITLSGAVCAQAQVWQTPYSTGSTADLTLRFNNGATNSVTSPAITFATVITYNSTPATGSGGGWGLSSSGSAAIGLGSVITGQTRTQTTAGGGTLAFQMVSSGLNNLVGLNLGSDWSATSTIAGSNTWSLPSTDMRYTFDAFLSADIITLNPAFFSSYSLTIQAGSNILYQGNLSTILPTITPVVTGASVEFSYNQADGPLQVTWSGDGTLNLALLTALGNGTSSIFGVTNAAIQVDAIPEPGTYMLLLGGMGAVAFFRRRRQS